MDATTRPIAAAAFAAALVVVPVVAVDPGGAAPFGAARWWAVSTLAAAFAAVSWWRLRRVPQRALLIAWAVLLATLALGALVNHDVRVAVLGHPARHLGLVTWVLFALVFVGGHTLASPWQRVVVARAAVVAGAITGLWCLWELVVGPPIALGARTQRLTGPFGSAAFLGAAVCLYAPFAIGRALDRSVGLAERVAAGVVAGLCGVALVGSGTRAAWIAAAVVATVVVARRRPGRRTALAVAGVALVAVVALVPRLDDVLERSAGADSRLDEWAVAVRVIGDHPLSGVGPEGYRIAAAEGIDRAYERAYPRWTVLPDRAHSAPLDVALSGGLVAAAAWVTVAVVVARRAWWAVGGDPLLAAIGAAVLAYLVQQLLLFPVAELDPTFWLAAGVLFALPATAMAPVRAARPLAAVAGALAAAAAVTGVLGVAADRLAGAALRSSDRDAAVDDAERAVRLRPDDIDLRMIASAARAARGTVDDRRLALEQADAALRWSPRDPVAADARATSMFELAVVTGDPIDTAEALEAWRVLVARDPHRARWQLQLGRAALLAGDATTARAALATAADLDPTEPTAARLLAGLT